MKADKAEARLVVTCSAPQHAPRLGETAMVYTAASMFRAIELAKADGWRFGLNWNRGQVCPSCSRGAA